MADASVKRKSLGRSASTESTDYSLTMGKSFRKKKPKERWLLTRKTWRYMADAGRKLIPDGAQNRPEDIPKIEAYFQEVCKKENRFLLWRKNSYPGALGFRKKRRKVIKGGSCRKACSEDEIVLGRPDRPSRLDIYPTTTGKFDLKKMKEDFLNQPTEHSDYNLFDPIKLSSESLPADPEERQLVSMLETYLKIADQPGHSKLNHEFNYQELVDKLQRHLSMASRQTSSFPGYYKPGQIHFQGDHVQKSLSETLSRYYGATGNRDKIVSDLLTDRKALEKLYFELRKTKGFRGSRGGTGYTTRYGCGPSQMPSYDLKATGSIERRTGTTHPPPLIEVQSETFEVTYRDYGTQTLAITEPELRFCEEEYKKVLAERYDDAGYKDSRGNRRRSSVDNDDVSQSVSDTIKRYLRMARKKSVDTEKADRFKRVNYDRNLRNIKAKGEITKPGDDDGLNKGCQTNEEWILTYRDLKFQEIAEVSDAESHVSSSRSSIDVGVVEAATPTSPPPHKSASHSFLSSLLHGKHEKTDKNCSSAVTAAAMQKSKSSSSVIPGGRLTKKIFRSRSKSQTRPSHTPCSWTPQGGCVWNSVTGRQVVLNDTSLLNLTDVERKVLQAVAIAKLQALNLGVNVKVPTENVGIVSKPKRRPYLLKRKALTTGIFDTSRKDAEKEGSTSGGLVFGIPLTQCVENDRIARAAAGTSPFRSRAELAGTADYAPATIDRHGSRASFSSLIDSPRGDERGSCESLMARGRMVGSVPGLLDKLSCGSTADITGAAMEDEASVPNIINECIRHLEHHGLHIEGIFRVSASKKRVRQLREDFDCGKETTLDEVQCPQDVATLLKEYLRDLPDPLLCRDLYQAFVQTQKIRNRRLQFEALQHLLQLLPPSNRDTLFTLLAFLATVAKYADDVKDSSGEHLPGNKMDSNNLATVFAPNILHCIKPGAKDATADRPEDRFDIINVVRTLIDHYKQLFTVSAALLDEVYVHMMDSNPEELDLLLTKKDNSLAADESVDELDSESNSAPWTPTMPTAEMSIESIVDGDGRSTPSEPKKTYSREEFLHEAAATGGPNVGMRIRHKDRIRERSERSLRRRREESATRKRSSEESSGISSAISLISKLRGQKDDEYQYGKHRSSSIESTSSTHTDSDLNRALRMSEDYERRKSSPYILDNSGVITASLTIPVQTQGQAYNVDDNIPYIEDGENGRQQLTIGVVRTPTAPPRRRQTSMSGSDSSLASNVQPITGSISLMQGYDSAMGSSATFSSPVQNTPTSISSSIADQGPYSSPPSWASSPPTSPDSNNTSVNYIPDEVPVQRPERRRTTSTSKDSPVVQKVSFSNTQEVQQISKQPTRKFSGTDINKTTTTYETEPSKREPKFTASISNIGNAVLRSKTQDFEKIIKVEAKAKTTANAAAEREKKKYTKRRYTDSRHQTRHIPDSEALESSAATSKKETTASLSQVGPFYKRRELISSVPTK